MMQRSAQKQNPKPTASLVTLLSLPHEILLAILLKLRPGTVAQVASVCIQLLQATRDPHLWKHKLKKHFPPYYDNLCQMIATRPAHYPEIPWQQKFSHYYLEHYPDDEFTNPHFSDSELTFFSATIEHDIHTLEAMRDFSPEILDKQDKHKNTPLMLAHRAPYQPLYHFFYKKMKEYVKQHPRYVDKWSRSLLYWAIVCQQPSMEILIQLRNRKNDERYFQEKLHAIHIAAQRGLVYVVKLLLQQNAALINCVDADNNTPLAWACIHGQEAVVAFLLTQKANIEIANTVDNNNGKTPLWWSVQHQAPGILRRLLQAKAAHTIPIGRRRVQPIHRAARSGNVEILSILLDHDATLLERPDSLGNTPLIYAATNGHVNAVAFLLSSKAKVNAASTHPDHDVRGKTALHYVAGRENAKEYALITKLLIQAGATSTPVDLNALHPIHIAAQHGNDLIIKAMLHLRPEWARLLTLHEQTPFFIAANRGCIPVLLRFLKKGYNVNATFNDGSDALFLAAQSDNCKMLNTLLEFGATAEQRPDFSDYFPIHAAISRHHYNVVKHLLTHRPKLLEQLDGHGFSPLYLAIQYNSAAIAHLLLSSGAKTTERIVQFAVLNRRNEMLNVLIQHEAGIEHLKGKDLSRLDPLLVAKIQLLLYVRNKESKAYYRFFSAKKIQAAKELKEVIIHQKRCNLNPYEKELNEGKLGTIYNRLRRW